MVMLDWTDALRVLAGLVLIGVVAYLTSRLQLKMVPELVVATLRAMVQLAVLALVLAFILQAGEWALLLIFLAVMLFFASYTSAHRLREMPNAFRVSSISIIATSSLVISFMVIIGALPMKGEYVITLGGMVIGNTMNINSWTLDRLRGEVTNQTARIEAALALGARYDQAVAPMVRRSIRSALIPNVDNMKTLGLVWIPGLMAGMV
ncbi:MAG TPA: ABC transporter permease, partial [Methanomassiliicoccales archaeon]|nr:ABC transporter permease [Methanomassiliicoccales archaeon]